MILQHLYLSAVTEQRPLNKSTNVVHGTPNSFAALRTLIPLWMAFSAAIACSES